MTDDVPEIQVELPEALNDGFDHPMVVDAVLYAFPGHLDKLMPDYESIPEEFRNPNNRNEWQQFVSDWFFKGWPDDRLLYERPDVPGEIAFRHLDTIMRSFEPKHEHKEAAVAWLMSRWFAAIRHLKEG